MKKHILLLSFCAFFAADLSAQYWIPKLGMNFTRLENDPADFKTSARAGWSAGLEVRLGRRAFIQPGAHFHMMNQNLSDPNNITKPKDVVGLQGLRAPACVGFSIINLDEFKFRAMAGASYYRVLGVTKNDLGVKKSDYRADYWGTITGIGIDLAILSFDAYYEWGQTGIFRDEPKTKWGTFGLSLGVKIHD